LILQNGLKLTMKNYKKTFIEICIYEARPEKEDEFEDLIKRVANHHKQYPGVIDVKYMKRTHRPSSFSDAKQGKPAINLTRRPKVLTYALCWELDSVATHGAATKSGLDKFFKNFNRCLTKMPRMILGKRLA